MKDVGKQIVKNADPAGPPVGLGGRKVGMQPRGRSRHGLVAMLIATGLLAAGAVQHLAAQTEVRKMRPGEVPSPGEEVIARAIELKTIGGSTRLTLDLSARVSASAYYLADPDRLVIDLPDVVFRLDRPPGVMSAGAVRDVRFGLLAPGRGRIVADTASPVRVIRTEVEPHPSGARLTIEIEVADRVAALLRSSLPPASEPQTPPAQQAAPAVTAPAARPAANARPVVVIDAGHGGIDPGAVGEGDVLEKDIVLAVARQVRAELAARGRYDVRMTREADVFVSLDQRLRMSAAANANLFISIHADSVGDPGLAGTVRGATVYTRSEEASSRDAAQAADRENAADARAGLSTVALAADDQVKGILLDLMRRETQTFSTDAQRVLVRSLGRVVTLARDPTRSAAFKVLQQPHSPAVLIELGYISNRDEIRSMQSQAWQKRAAEAIATAVDDHFQRTRRAAPQR